jgi:3-isopropylmalate/(R)-2-methylmalate dehydratase large subunit
MADSPEHLSCKTGASTLFAKIWDRHVIAESGDAVLVGLDRVWLHERTGGVALTELERAGRAVCNPAHVFVTMDHVVDTLPGRTDATQMPTGQAFIQATRTAAHRNGLTLFDIGDERQGIVHTISVEQGVALPGLTLVCPDSHTSTQGAIGCLAWGIGSTEAEHALATATLRIERPRTMQIVIDGVLRRGVYAKDLALYIISQIGSAGGKGHVVEFAGEAVTALSIEGRMTLCNMGAELGAFAAIIAPDEKVVSYLQGRPYAPAGVAWQAAVADWRELASDPGAVFDAEHRFDAADVRPMISWGTNPEQSRPIGPGEIDAQQSAALGKALAYMGLEQAGSVEGLAIAGAFIGSCTNARIEDLREAAIVLDGRRVAPGVRAICVPSSGSVKALAEAEGIDRIFRDAGFEWREPGCSMCFFVGGESFGAGERVVSSTNRNFENRQGPGTRTHIASPATVAASAVLGRIAGASELPPRVQVPA